MITAAALAAHLGCSAFLSLDGYTSSDAGGGPASGDAGDVARDGGPVVAADADSDVSAEAATSFESGSCGSLDHAAASSLHDDFAATPLGPAWNAVNCAQAKDGELVAAPTSTAYCFATTTGSYRLTCDSVTVKVPEVTTLQLGVQTFLYVTQSNGSQQFNVILEAGGFQAGTMTITGGLYDPVKDLWWRLREADGELYFETSPDGLTWTTRGHQPDPMPLDDVHIALGAGLYSQEVASPGRARFDCYNVAAPCPP